MSTYRYERVQRTSVKRGLCPRCGRLVRRQRTFWQTVNPFNKNADGAVKTRAEISDELRQWGNAWEPDFTHEDCEATS